MVVDGKMVYFAGTATSADIVLVRHAHPGGIDLVENALLRVAVPVHVKIIEERRHGIAGDVRIRKRCGLVLGGAIANGDEAVGAHVGLRTLLGVDLHVEGQGDAAIAVVFVIACRVPKVAWCG